MLLSPHLFLYLQAPMVLGHQWEVWWGLRKSPLLLPNKAGENAKETCNTYRKPPMQRRRFPLTEKLSTMFTSLFENTHGKWIYTWKNSEMKLMLGHFCVAHWGLQFSWCTINDMFLTTKCHLQRYSLILPQPKGMGNAYRLCLWPTRCTMEFWTDYLSGNLHTKRQSNWLLIIPPLK